ncbi:unnamed protein product [Calypogeia fissa]
MVIGEDETSTPPQSGKKRREDNVRCLGNFKFDDPGQEATIEFEGIVGFPNPDFVTTVTANPDLDWKDNPELKTDLDSHQRRKLDPDVGGDLDLDSEKPNSDMDFQREGT